MLAPLALAAIAPMPLILAHYMPWHQAPPFSKEYGWHWTMNHFDPAKGELASRLHPLIGPYDNTDPDVLEYHTLLMKIAGIDGAILDWYGIDDVYDYAFVHKASQMFVDKLSRSKMKFGICYEDQTLPNLIKFGVTSDERSTAYGHKVLAWADKNWFKRPNYIKMKDRPALLVFGPQFFKPEQWTEMREGMDIDVYGVMGPYDFDNAGFAWPAPRETYSKSIEETDSFYDRAKGKLFIAGAYPRFMDVYKTAGLNYGHPEIDDRGGETFRSTLRQAIESGSPIIQIATWNDWGEGTVIEPSKEYGYRDLEQIQQMRRDLLHEKPIFSKADLRLPLRLFLLRKKKAKGLEAISPLIQAGRSREAAKKLSAIEARTR
jgi:hypothetical protein